MVLSPYQAQSQVERLVLALGHVRTAFTWSCISIFLRVPHSRLSAILSYPLGSAICMVSRECSILSSNHWSTRRLTRLWVASGRRSPFTHSWRTYSVRLFIRRV